MAKKRSPFMAEAVKGGLFALMGILLIVQPFLPALALLGWLMVICGAMVALVMGLRLRSARRMTASPIAEFSSGDAVYANGLRIGGTLYDFSTLGSQLKGCSFDGSNLSFSYTYAAKGGARKQELAGFAVPPEEADLARLVVDRLALPPADAPGETGGKKE